MRASAARARIVQLVWGARGRSVGPRRVRHCHGERDIDHPDRAGGCCEAGRLQQDHDQGHYSVSERYSRCFGVQGECGRVVRKLEIAIIGGSIAGCSAGILLAQAGHDVHIYERSPGGLVGRGGGIGTPRSVLSSLVEQGIVEADLPHLAPSSYPVLVRTATESEQGHTAWGMQGEMALFHWTSLWRSLRRHVPDDRYHHGANVVDAVEAPSGRVDLRFNDGSATAADLVVWSDGYQSLGRRLMFPGVELSYRGYMLWRGLLHERQLETVGPLESTLARLFHPTIRGSTVMYLVPGHDGSNRPGGRLVNWASYIPLPAEELASFMVDRSGNPLVGSIPPGQMRLDEENGLKALMAAELPDYHAELVARTVDTSVQLIYTARTPGYHRGHMLLAGDAGSIAQPFTGSGVFKGLNNVSGLVEMLQRYDDVDRALEAWGASQVQLADRLLALGEQMEDAFIWNPIDLATADAASIQSWWRAAVTYPEDFDLESRK